MSRCRVWIAMCSCCSMWVAKLWRSVWTLTFLCRLKVTRIASGSARPRLPRTQPRPDRPPARLRRKDPRLRRVLSRHRRPRRPTRHGAHRPPQPKARHRRRHHLPPLRLGNLQRSSLRTRRRPLPRARSTHPPRPPHRPRNHHHPPIAVESVFICAISG